MSCFFQNEKLRINKFSFYHSLHFNSQRPYVQTVSIHRVCLCQKMGLTLLVTYIPNRSSPGCSHRHCNLGCTRHRCSLGCTRRRCILGCTRRRCSPGCTRRCSLGSRRNPSWTTEYWRTVGRRRLSESKQQPETESKNSDNVYIVQIEIQTCSFLTQHRPNTQIYLLYRMFQFCCLKLWESYLTQKCDKQITPFINLWAF